MPPNTEDAPGTPNQVTTTEGRAIDGHHEPVAANVPPLFSFDEFENYAKRFLSTLSAPSSKKPSAEQGISGEKETAPSSQIKHEPVVKKDQNTVLVTHHNVELSITKNSDNSAVVAVNGHDKNLETLLQFFKSMAEDRKTKNSERVAFEITEPKSLTEEQLLDLLNKIEYNQELLQFVEIRLHGKSLLLTQDSVTEITNKHQNNNLVNDQDSEDSDDDVVIEETSGNNLAVEQGVSGAPGVTSHHEVVPLSDAMSQGKSTLGRVTVTEERAPVPVPAPSAKNTAPVTTPHPVTATTPTSGANSQPASPGAQFSRPVISNETVTHPTNSPKPFGFFSACFGKGSNVDPLGISSDPPVSSNKR